MVLRLEMAMVAKFSSTKGRNICTKSVSYSYGYGLINNFHGVKTGNGNGNGSNVFSRISPRIAKNVCYSDDNIVHLRFAQTRSTLKNYEERINSLENQYEI